MSYSRLMRPRTIAVFGGWQAQEVIRQSDRLGYDGAIWPVHPKKTEIQGRRVFRSVSELPDSPDAAYVGVNRHLTIDIVRDLAERRAGGAICYATGFSEAGEEGATLEQQLMQASGDMPLVGPNCYGMLNYLEGAALWPDQQGGRRVEDGVAIITMSSNVAFNLTMQRRGLPIAFLMSLGNKLKFDLHDAIRMYAREEKVSAIGLYLEGISDLSAFEHAINDARELGKPVVAIKTGRSETAQKMVLSHTASLAGSDQLMGALFDRIGVARVDSLEALIEALKVLHVLGPLKGGRTCAMSTSGGDLTLLADAMIGTDLTMPPLSDPATQGLRSVVHDRIVAANPLDYQMFNWNDADRLADTFGAFICKDFDVSLCLLDYPREDRCDQGEWNGAEQGFVRAAQRTGASGAVLSTFSDTISEPVAARLIREGIVPLAGIDAGLAGIQAAVDIGAAWRRPPQPPSYFEKTPENDSGLITVLDEARSKSLLKSLGVPVPPSAVVHTPREAVSAAEQLGFPVVVKALGVVHKTDAGAVKLGLNNPDDVLAAAEHMSDLSQRLLVETMIQNVVAELIVGVARDHQFGPHLLVGGGGIQVELTKDSAPLLLPVTKEQVIAILHTLRCAPLFHGFRGAPCADLEAAADAILAIADFVGKNPTVVEELDINPLLLLAKSRGVMAADALISIRSVDSE